MPSPEIWKMRGLLHIGDGVIEPLVTPPENDDFSNQEFIRRVVWSFNQTEALGGMVEVSINSISINPDESASFTTAYQFETAIPAYSILPPIRPYNRRATIGTRNLI